MTIDDSSNDKKTKGTKKCVIRNTNFENYRNCFEATQLENKLNYSEKNKMNVFSFKEDTKNQNKKDNELVLQIHQLFKSEKHNV